MSKIECKTKIKNTQKKIRVKVIRAPIVNSEELKRIVFARAKAIVL